MPPSPREIRSTRRFNGGGAFCKSWKLRPLRRRDALLELSKRAVGAGGGGDRVGHKRRRARLGHRERERCRAESEQATGVCPGPTSFQQLTERATRADAPCAVRYA